MCVPDIVDQQNRVAVLTPAGRGAIAVIAAEGEAAERAIDRNFAAANGRRCAEQTLGRIVFGLWQGEEVVLCRRSETLTEVHCHGGSAAVERVATAFIEAGCVRLDWQAWLEAHAQNRVAAEARIALAAATTRRTMSMLLDQLNGALEREVATITHLIDQQQVDLAVAKLQRLNEQATLGLRLTRGWKVVIAGKPNGGKSSLINAILGYQRAIVFDQPGTTRDVVSATTALDGWPVQLTDVAGLRISDDALEAAGVALARQQIKQADLVVWVFDAGEFKGAGREARVASEWMEYCEAPLVVVNKIDLTNGEPEASVTGAFAMGASPLAVSALTGVGLKELIAAIVARLVPLAPEAGEGMVFTARQEALVLDALEMLRAGELRGACEACRRVLYDVLEE